MPRNVVTSILTVLLHALGTKEVVDLVTGLRSSLATKTTELLTVEKRFSEWKEEVIALFVQLKLQATARDKIFALMDYLREKSRKGDIHCLQNFITATVLFETVGITEFNKEEKPAKAVEVPKLSSLSLNEKGEGLKPIIGILEHLASLIPDKPAGTYEPQDFQRAIDFLASQRMIGRSPMENIIAQAESWLKVSITAITEAVKEKLPKVAEQLQPAEGGNGIDELTKGLVDLDKWLRKKIK